MFLDALDLWPLLPGWMETLVEADAGPIKGLGLDGWKPAPGGRVLHWDVFLTRIQSLGHYDPVQQVTWVLNCYMETESSAPKNLRKRAAARIWQL